MAKNKLIPVLFFTIGFYPLLWAQEANDSIKFLKDSLIAITSGNVNNSIPVIISPSLLDSKPDLPKFSYNVKDRSISFTAPEVEIKALAYQEDSRWNFERGFVRALYGNAKNPNLQAGTYHQKKESYDISFLGQYTSLNQAELFKNLNYRYIDGRVKSHIITGENVVMTAGMYASMNRFTLWHPTSAIETGSHRNIFNHQLNVHFSNIELAQKGWNWKTGITTKIINISNDNGFEAGIMTWGSAHKALSKNFNFNVEAESQNIYTIADSNTALDIFHAKPVFSFSNTKFNIKAGLHFLVATNSGINFFPLTEFSYTLTKSGISIFAGTSQEQHHNTLGYSSTINPYLFSKAFLNTASWSNHIFGGIRIFNSALALETKIGTSNSYNNLLFIQTEQLSEEFTVKYDDISNLYFRTSVQYFPIDFLTVNASFDLVRYNPATEENAINLPGADVKVGCDLKLFNQKLVITPDLQYLNIIRQTNISSYGDNELLGINIQAAFRIYKKLNVIAQGNNLLNSTFDRWNGYRYFGRNFAAGINWIY